MREKQKRSEVREREKEVKTNMDENKSFNCQPTIKVELIWSSIWKLEFEVFLIIDFGGLVCVWLCVERINFDIIYYV